ncbi:Alpha/beta hydrolase fold-1 [Penicillium lagena]|uniref:Alpha/beta hydrolase fold-1 n=1 Tax=Penicillium lagena TaxID=94218 RepID=UPI0025414D7E|nr:Alpha/beta hydrolase fold-1 [Penicillium lagena]KAJ5610745.1 Alpha/beta hydrolase fold-1 [Penicillium lagena]
MYANDDLTWNQSNSFIWSSVEPCIGITCACLPTLRPLIRRIFPTWLESGKQGISTGRSFKSGTSYHSSGRVFRPQDEEEIVLTNTFGKGDHMAPSDHTTISVERDVGCFPLLAVTGASFTLGLLVRSLFSRIEHRQTVLLSPRASLLPSLSDAENRKLPLPNDVLPGARDVVSPFGRGYSDCPADLPQDERLFSTQILLALTSSPLAWTGAESGKFCLVGYSLGGGIATAFASFFPQLLSSLVLLAPAGLVRDSQISFKTHLLYSRGLMPECLLSFMVARRLRAGPLVSPKPKSEKLNAADALTEELPSQSAAAVQILSREYPNINVPSAVTWQVNNHAGFVHAFMSSMRHGPILAQRQRNTWTRLGNYLTVKNSTTAEGQPAHKVHILCGINDAIIIKDELVPDATAALGGNAVFKFYEAGHEFPSTKYEEVATYISEIL